MEHSPDHYAALGISPAADQDVIAAAYRALLKKFHPDTGTARGTASKERLAQVLDAFEVLGNPQSRADYDAERASSLPSPGDDEEQPMALEARAARYSGPTLGPAGARAASGATPRRAPSKAWLALPLMFAGTTAAWLLTAEDAAPPPPPAVTVAPPVAEQPAATVAEPPPAVEDTPPAPPPAKKAETPVQLPEPPAAEPEPPQPSAFVLVMGEDGTGGATTLSDGKLIFNSQSSCENFAAQASERRREAAVLQTGAVPNIWHECRPARR